MNKFFKYTFIALLGVLTLGLSSCTDEYEYTQLLRQSWVVMLSW